MRPWLAFLLVIISALTPIEHLAETIDGEIVVRSLWSVALVASCYFVATKKQFLVILFCELLAVEYNLAIAFGYYFTDTDLSAHYGSVMTILFMIELIATLPEPAPSDKFKHRDNCGNSGSAGNGRIDCATAAKGAPSVPTNQERLCKL